MNPSEQVLFFVDHDGRFSLQPAGGQALALSAEQIRLIADLAHVSQASRK